MRHRIGGLQNVYMGLGADNIPYELDNTWSDNEKLNKVSDDMFNEALEKIFEKRDIGGFDYKVTGNQAKFDIMFGREPAYKHDPYLMCYIGNKKEDSYIENGVATGYYGKEVKIESRKRYGDSEYDKEFNEFVDKWHPLLLDTMTIKCV